MRGAWADGRGREHDASRRRNGALDRLPELGCCVGSGVVSILLAGTDRS